VCVSLVHLCGQAAFAAFAVTARLTQQHLKMLPHPEPAVPQTARAYQLELFELAKLRNVRLRRPHRRRRSSRTRSLTLSLTRSHT